MYKIYSRKRIRIPNIKYGFNKNEKKQKYARKISKIALILFIAFSVVNIVLRSVTPIFETLCEDEAKSIATLISNEQATIVMKQYSYEELFSIEKDNEGNITMIKSNVFPINEIISDVALKIQEEINKKGRDDVEIAMRKFYRN
jgi:hypothetical protein